MLTVPVPLQLLASETVTVYTPADKLFTVLAFIEFGSQLKVYGEVPLETETVAEPLVPPLQVTFVLLILKFKEPICNIVATAFELQPLASVILAV